MKKAPPKRGTRAKIVYQMFTSYPLILAFSSGFKYICYTLVLRVNSAKCDCAYLSRFRPFPFHNQPALGSNPSVGSIINDNKGLVKTTNPSFLSFFNGKDLGKVPLPLSICYGEDYPYRGFQKISRWIIF